MTTRTSPCEEFEIAALRRARGALDADATTRLDAHLASCAGCRGFAATAEATESALHARVRTAEASRDWDAVRSSFKARRRRVRAAATAGWCLVLPLVVVFWLTLSPFLFGALTTWLVVMLFLAGRGGAAQAARARRAEAVDDELLAFYRTELDREIAVLRRSLPLLPLLTVSFGGMIVAFLAVIAHEAYSTGSFDPRPLMLMAALPVVYAWLRYRAKFVLPRLERERAELGQ